MLKPIPGYPHFASDLGEIFREGNPKALKPCEAKNGGYFQVSLWVNGKGKTHFVHQLVAMAFHGTRPSPRHHAAHRDGNKKNNTPANVQWITKEENEADKILHGTTNRGERNGSAKVSDEQAVEICNRARTLPRSTGGVKFKKGALTALAVEYGLSASGAWQIINGYRRQA